MVAHHHQQRVVKVSIVPKPRQESEEIVVGEGDKVEVVVTQLSMKGEAKLGSLLVHRHEVAQVVKHHLEELIKLCTCGLHV